MELTPDEMISSVNQTQLLMWIITKWTNWLKCWSVTSFRADVCSILTVYCTDSRSGFTPDLRCFLDEVCYRSVVKGVGCCGVFSRNWSENVRQTIVYFIKHCCCYCRVFKCVNKAQTWNFSLQLHTFLLDERDGVWGFGGEMWERSRSCLLVRVLVTAAHKRS